VCGEGGGRGGEVCVCGREKREKREKGGGECLGGGGG
jgi:hypothetical protein